MSPVYPLHPETHARALGIRFFDMRAAMLALTVRAIIGEPTTVEYDAAARGFYS